MRIENITSDNIKELPEVELRNLKIKFINIYDRHFVDPEITKAVALDREIFFDKYIILRTEMKLRKVTCMEGVALDKEIDPRIFQKSVWGIDIPSLGPMMIVRSYVALSGAFIKSPKLVKNVEVVIRNIEKDKDERLENKLTMIIKSHMQKIPIFKYSPAGPEKSYIPVFDLVLRPREEAKKIKQIQKVKMTKKTILTKKTFAISKPEETNNMISIPVGPDCEITATITIDKAQGITALYCGKIKKVRTFKFDKRIKAWTMATARAWIKEHKEKVEKQIAEKLQKQQDEENLETFEYLIHHVEVEGDKEIIHHCHMYDHIGNLFEQSHLYFDKGKVYLDGKEIKEGHYHVIKGLEPKQEVAWSEEEATKAGIKPKGMMSGMTLKEKAKAW